MSRGAAPRENPELLGHAPAEARLAEAAQAGRLAHAWLIAGPKGVGKATLAFRFARHLLAGGGEGGGGLFGGPPDLALDPGHPVFRQVATGAHPGLHLVQRTVAPAKRSDISEFRSEAEWRSYIEKNRRTEITIEDVRAAGHFFRMTASEGGWRIAIVDCADEMNRNAANALLKVLEEPPPRSLLLLVCHAPGRMLPTIRSRCQILALQPLDDAAVVRLLRERHASMGETELASLARLAEGSPGRALDLAGKDGLALYGEVVSLLQGLPRIDLPRLDALAERAGRPGEEGAETFEAVSGLLRWWIARLVRFGATRAAPPEVAAGETALMDRLAGRAPLDRWVEVWEKISRLVARTDAVNLDRKMVIVTAFLACEEAAGG